jgi:hypothetical protein
MITMLRRHGTTWHGDEKIDATYSISLRYLKKKK